LEHESRWKGALQDAKCFDDLKNMSLTSRSQILETDIKMSSLSRRACYKCGNVGHYAEVCSSSERLCYNCKQPGESRLRTNGQVIVLTL
jgi:hypothetical protein